MTTRREFKWARRRVVFFLAFIFMFMFGLARCADAGELVETGISYGWAHNSNPFAGAPFNDHYEVAGDTLAAGKYWDWGKTEFHLWVGIKRDSIHGFGDKWAPAAQFLLIRKRKR